MTCIAYLKFVADEKQANFMSPNTRDNANGEIPKKFNFKIVTVVILIIMTLL